VTLTYYPRDRRRRDPLNMSATQKPIVDAIVDWRLVPDDTPEYVDDRLPVIAEPDGDPRLELVITEVS
jgi:crossover junction endodeoxyribonuclease RusA